MLCKKDKVMILNGSFLQAPNMSYRLIFKHFVLPVNLRIPRAFDASTQESLLLNEKIYDIFYQPEKQNRIQEMLGQTTKEELSKNFYKLFYDYKLLSPNARHHLLSSINEFFTPEVIQTTKLQIQAEALKTQVMFKSDVRQQKRKEVKQHLLKKISKLAGSKRFTFASITKKTNIPYHQVRQILHESQTNTSDFQ